MGQLLWRQKEINRGTQEGGREAEGGRTNIDHTSWRLVASSIAPYDHFVCNRSRVRGDAAVVNYRPNGMQATNLGCMYNTEASRRVVFGSSMRIKTAVIGF